ncbi:MAG: DUF2336 domain-containing protein [Rhodospirillales bacterium]
MSGFFKNLFKGGARGKASAYEGAKELARHEDWTVRRELAARPDLRPEILYFLAEDPAPEVRRKIAANATTPAQADLLLAGDADDGVRGDLAAKIAALAPDLSADEQDKVRHMAYEALTLLARDQATRVRQILAEALKDVAGAPPEVIGRLARDAELLVAAPVLRFSPVLTDADLLEIIGSDPASGRLAAISERDGVAEPVVDAIVATDDEEAVALLLANPSAQIREQTLDWIIDRAPKVEPWHAPLVRRPRLPARAVARLAEFVAHDLLEALRQREDLDPDVLAEVRDVVARRLAEEAGPPLPAEESTPEGALKRIKELWDTGRLDEDAVADAIKTGDRELTIAALAAMAGLEVAMVRTVIGTGSAKGMVAIAWKAGLSAMLAETLQQKLARVPPDHLLRARGADYPLDTDALEWQLDFIRDRG